MLRYSIATVCTSVSYQYAEKKLIDPIQQSVLENFRNKFPATGLEHEGRES